MEEKKKSFYADFLTEREIKRDGELKSRMEKARDERNQARDEWDGLDYLSAYDRDAKTALAFIPAVKNDGENPISTGTSRQSLITLISRAISYNYDTEFRAFDKRNEELAELGKGLEIAVSHSNFLDDEDYEEKAAFELLAHGDEIGWCDWVKEWGTKKSIPAFDGKVTGVNWTEKKAVIFEGVRRKVIQGRRFYFGDIFTDSIDQQPFCFMVNHIDYSDAKRKYGTWERWKHVPDIGQKSDFDWSAYAEDWRLEDSAPDGTIEEKIYVSVPDNEMQIWLNGVPMLPIGYPMKWEHGKYPWEHVGAEPIRTGFIYHRSFIRTLQNMQELENDMWRVLVMLAWKAAMPALANDSGRVLTRRDIMAGEIVTGVSADDLRPIDDGSLAHLGYVQNVAQLIRDNMTGRSVPETKQGMSSTGEQTATEVTQINKEAEVAISLNLRAIAKIVARTDWLTASLILQHAFKEGYKAASERPGKGGVVRHVLEVTDELQSSRDIDRREDEVEQRTGRKTRIIQLRPKVREIMESLYSRAVPRPRASSALDKVELQGMAQAAIALFGPRFNPEFLEDEFRRAYRIDSSIPLLVTNPMPEIQKGSPPKPAQPLPNQMISNEPPIA